MDYHQSQFTDVKLLKHVLGWMHLNADKDVEVIEVERNLFVPIRVEPLRNHRPKLNVKQDLDAFIQNQTAHLNATLVKDSQILLEEVEDVDTSNIEASGSSELGDEEEEDSDELVDQEMSDVDLPQAAEPQPECA